MYTFSERFIICLKQENLIWYKVILLIFALYINNKILVSRKQKELDETSRNPLQFK